MYFTRFDPGEKWTSRFYFGVTLFAMAGILMMSIPDGAIEALTAAVLVQR